MLDRILRKKVFGSNFRTGDPGVMGWCVFAGAGGLDPTIYSVQEKRANCSLLHSTVQRCRVTLLVFRVGETYASSSTIDKRQAPNMGTAMPMGTP